MSSTWGFGLGIAVLGVAHFYKLEDCRAMSGLEIELRGLGLDSQSQTHFSSRDRRSLSVEVIPRSLYPLDRYPHPKLLPKLGGCQRHSATSSERLAGIYFVTICVFNNSVPSNPRLFWCLRVACRIVFCCSFQLEHTFFVRTF